MKMLAIIWHFIGQTQKKSAIYFEFWGGTVVKRRRLSPHNKKGPRSILPVFLGSRFQLMATETMVQCMQLNKVK